MAALTGPKEIVRIDSPSQYRIQLGVAASTRIWRGAIVSMDLLGVLVPASDTAGTIVRGVALETVDNLAGVSGAKSCWLLCRTWLKIDHAAAFSVVDIGNQTSAYMLDDQTVQTAAAATNDVPISVAHAAPQHADPIPAGLYWMVGY